MARSFLKSDPSGLPAMETNTMKKPAARSTDSRGRRRLLRHLTFAAASGLWIPRHAIAAGPAAPRQGIRRMRGSVIVNGAAARVGTIVPPGARVTTGRGAEAAYVIGNDAFLQRADSRVEIGEGAAVFRILTGALMSVFGRGPAKTIQTVTVTAGIRGTGCYVHVEPKRTYFCLCYGTVDLTPVGGQPRSYTTRHHDSPYWIANGAVTTGEIMRHEDSELQFLESLVGRQVPFGVPYKR
jgi:hypothetical protein